MVSPSTNIRVGVSGWSYDDWQGIVYPQVGHVDRLTYLGGYFDTLEVNTSFYRPPAASMTANWVDRTPKGLDFAFKLHQRFTHQAGVEYSQAEVDEFCRGVEPVFSAGRMGPLLMQFPWSFRFDDPARSWLERLARDFGRYELVVEVRHKGWEAPEAVEFLRGLGVSLATIDQPDLPGNLPPMSAVTGPVGYVRLHGRNRKEWFASARRPQATSAQRLAARDARYDYLYSAAELCPWAERIADLAGKTQRTYAFANNHARGQAVANALQLKAMLAGAKVQVPEPMLDAFTFLRDIAAGPQRQGSLF